MVRQVPSFPFSLDWLPDGRQVIITARDQAVMTAGADGKPIT